MLHPDNVHRWLSAFTVYTAVILTGCGNERATPADDITAFLAARVIDGTGNAPIEPATIVVRDGRVQAVGNTNDVSIPETADRIDLAGRTIVPGFINAHGHVGATSTADSGPALRAELLRELRLYARYGVTTVNSLGGDGPESVSLRDEQLVPWLDRARLYVAGTVVVGNTPDEAVGMVDENAAHHVDFIKIRVDDNLGTAQKMPPEVFRAVIDRAHEHQLPLAAHLYYLDDAKALVQAGADLVAHSVRDQLVDDELIELLNERGVCYVPTLTREVSTFVYEREPEFFADPFFLRDADSAVIEQLLEPATQQRIRESTSAQQYKIALDMALQNVRRLAEGGVTIALGTDTGPFARFQGYFEHMEMALMADAGMTPAQILRAATGDAARCLGFDDVGTIEPGKWADFVVLTEDPLADIMNTRSIESVWIAGNEVPAR